MKFFALIGGSIVAVALVACGNGSSGASQMALSATQGAATSPKPTDTGHPEASVTEVTGPHSTLKIQIPPGPPSKNLVVKDLRKGFGSAVAGADDEVVVNYVAITEGTGKIIYDTWEKAGPSRFHLKAMRTGWELGLKGMRVGGRRELIVPSRLAYGTGALIYLVDMLRIRPWAS